jgi:hypothetical protein
MGAGMVSPIVMLAAVHGDEPNGNRGRDARVSSVPRIEVLEHKSASIVKKKKLSRG